MRVLSLNTDPIHELSYLNASHGPGGFEEVRLPVLEAAVDHLPESVEAIVATGDLQGRERFEDAGGGPLRLPGEVLPGWLAETVFARDGYPRPDQVSVWLAGDLYTVPALDRRGGTGDVTAVWKAMREVFGWVAGVAGNHDLFGTALAVRPHCSRSSRMHFLDGERVSIGGLTIAGVSGIIGNPRRPQRKSEEQYLALVERLLGERPDVLLLHDGPEAPFPGCRGSASVREVAQRCPATLIVRGHAYWPTPLVELVNGTQVLNVDARVVLLRQATG